MPAPRRHDSSNPASVDEAHRHLSEAAVPPSAAEAEDLFAEALDLVDAGDYAAGAEAYRQWLSRFGLDPVVCFNLAHVLYLQGEVGGALEGFRQATQLDPGDRQAWTNLGSVLAQCGQIAEAEDAFRAALALQPRHAATLYHLADALEQAGRTAEATDVWLAFLDEEAEGPWADDARARLGERAE